MALRLARFARPAMRSMTIARPVVSRFGQNFRAFSDEARTESAQKLATTLSYQIEDAEEHLMNEEDYQFIPNDYNMEKSNDTEITFTRNFGKESVSIEVCVSDIEESGGDEEDDYEDEEVDEDDEEAGGGELGVSTLITFKKEGAKDLAVEAVAWSESGWSLSKITNSDDEYSPKVEDLDEELVNSMYGYMEERGIDNELATHIAGVSYGMESQLYMNWLKTFQGHVTK